MQKIKQLVDAGEIGDLYFIDSVRINLGLFQHDVNVVWDLAPHDLSILDYLRRPVAAERCRRLALATPTRSARSKTWRI